jgi:DNA-binding NarL/FixJ family response regulator
MCPLNLSHFSTCMEVMTTHRPSHSILIVDDNAYVRKALVQLLTSECDFQICGEASNGHEAVEKAEQFQPDLIILDFSMPFMNGLEAAQEIKCLTPAIPVIMYTAFWDSFVEAQALKAGVSAFISKAQDSATLVSTARALLTRKAA